MDFTIEQDGFNGSLLLSSKPIDKDKIIIVCGGSEGAFKKTELMATTLVEHGFNTLALQYINGIGLPKHTIEAPIESGLNAVKHLKSIGYQKIGIYGSSSGGEYALVVASHCLDITTVITISAPTAISQADNTVFAKNTSCWSINRTGMPFIPVQYSLPKILVKSIVKRELYSRNLYDAAIKNAPSDAWIEVEKIHGPILFLSAENDSVCPATIFADLAMMRLNHFNSKHRSKHISYEYGSHFLLPVEHPKNTPLSIFAVERKFPKECPKSRLDALHHIITWLTQW